MGGRGIHDNLVNGRDKNESTIITSDRKPVCVGNRTGGIRMDKTKKTNAVSGYT